MDTIYGHLEYCFGGLPVIRGYCDAKTILSHSQAHPAYQRTPNDNHVKEIEDYITSTSLKFMPEIVLAYDFSGLLNSNNIVDPIYTYYNSKKSIILTDELTKVSFQFLKSGPPSIHTLKIELPDSCNIFRRIDGNHRLLAFEESNKKETIVSYCIVMLCSSSNDQIAQREKDEMEIFHNINSKAKPLTKIEQYRGLFRYFESYELSKYGDEFSITKNYLIRYNDITYNNISFFMNDKEETVLSCVKFLLEKSQEINENDIADIFSKLEHTYFCDYGIIRHCRSKQAIIPYVYYCMTGGKQKNAKLDAYNTWFIKNKLYNVVDFDPKSMIEIFDSIYEIRKKQIFVAMPFQEDLNFVFDTICRAVQKINHEYGTELEKPVRIDKQITGFSYDIVEELLEQIKNAGLLIADLTNQNANVYYEAGYAQGLLKAKVGNTTEILYLLSNPEKPDEPFNAAKFDIQHYKMIPYKNVGNGVAELEKDLIKELKAFYNI